MPALELMDSRDRETLRRMWEGLYLSGCCYHLAEALHRGLDWPIVGIVHEDGRIPHAGVRAPDGRLFDIRGHVTPEEFSAPFALTEAFELRHITSEDILGSVRPDEPACERGIRQARALAELLWPELPWRESSFAPMLAFTRELEALCRRHDYWIGGTNVFITAAAGETGYCLRTDPNPYVVRLERSYEPESGCLHTGHVPKLDGAFCPACGRPRVPWPVNDEALKGGRRDRS